MCDLISGIIGAVSIASTITGSVAQSKQVEAQAKAINEANLYNANQAVKEQLDLSNSEGIRQGQERQALAVERFNLKREGMQKASRARATTNAEGIALDMVMGEYDRIDGNNSDIIDQQLAMQDLGHTLAVKSYGDRAKARIGGLQGYNMYSNPALDILGTGLQIGGDVLGAFNYFGNKPRPKDNDNKK